MLKLIDKNLLLSYLGAITPENPVSSFGENAIFVIEKIKEYVNAMPTFEPEVRHGRWLPCLMLKYRYECGCCGEPSNYPTPYCPNCGARMDGGADS